jgi:hypothetical protein
MRKLLSQGLVAVLLLGLGTQVLAQEPGNPRAIVEKAIEAQGGAEKMAQLKAAKLKAKGTVFLAGMEIPFKIETLQQLPSQAKNVMKLDFKGMEIDVIEVLNGDKGWQSVNGQTKEADDKSLDQMKDAQFASYVTMLTPLLKDKTFELTSLPESKVNDKAAVGVKVASKGHKDIKLYFDKASGLLVKLSRPGVDPITKQMVTQDEFYSDYRAVEGVKMPHRLLVHQDGQKFMEAEMLEFGFVRSFDAKVFAAPGN